MANKTKEEMGIIEGPIRWRDGAVYRSLRMGEREWKVSLDRARGRGGMVCELSEILPPGADLSGPVVLSRGERAALVKVACGLFRATLERQWRALYPEHY